MIPAMNVERQPLFAPGQLVQHVRYGYRGVVVDFDMTCQADEMWYYRNQTQPGRNQPWYHVLVDGSMTTTYAAQTSLRRDASGKQIVHPWVSLYFSAFEQGGYVRNARPWPPNG